MTLPIRLEGGGVELVTLQGRGYHPADPERHASPLPSEGDRELASWAGYAASPSQLLAAHRLVLPSHDTLALGTTLPGGLVRQASTLFLPSLLDDGGTATCTPWHGFACFAWR